MKLTKKETYNVYLSRLIDPIHEWLPIKNCFESIKISPTNLILSW